MIAALKDKMLAGTFAIGNGSTEACTQVLSSGKGSKFIVQAASFPWPDEIPTGTLRTAAFAGGVTLWMASTGVTGRIKGVRMKFIDTKRLHLADNKTSRFVYGDFLENTMAESQYAAKPEPLVVGRRLEYVQEAFDVQAKDVSARKVVVSL